MNINNFFREPVSEHTNLLVSISNQLYKGKSKYQEIIVAELLEYGRALILDNLIQLSENDEAYYHESLVHPALFSHENPKEILILGGGDGCAARECLKHNPKEITLVDIDEEVINVSKFYLSNINMNSLEDNRVKVVVEDGIKFVERIDKKYDCIVIDLTDPFGSPIGKKLYSKEFYGIIKRRLKENGIMVTQAGTAFYYYEVYNQVLQNVKQSFLIVREYNVWIPSFGYACCFIIASDSIDPLNISRETIEKRINDRNVKTKFYTPEVHEALFRISLTKKLNKN